MAVGAAAAASLTGYSRSETAVPKGEPFKYCLNTSTIRGQKLTLAKEIELASKAGYQAIEPWISEIDDHVKGGLTLKDLSKRVRDNGLTVESAIGFAEWIVEDDSRRARGMEHAKRDMDLVAQIGGFRIAAPPAGATDNANLDLHKAAERYRLLLELGDRMGVVPMVELWGFSKCLHLLGETAYVAIESGHPKACILIDVYHIYKGGSDIDGLKLLSRSAIHHVHMNDYPSSPPRETITDAHRVYPGDGVAPMDTILRDLSAMGPGIVLSVELFNPEYYKQDALAVAKTALEKTKAAVKQSQRSRS